MRVRVYAAAMLCAWSAAVVGAQGPKVTTPEELDKVMKKVGPAMQASQKAMGGPNYAEVKTQIAIVKQGVLDSQQFWIEHKREDALKFNKDTLAKLDAFEKTIATDTVELDKSFTDDLDIDSISMMTIVVNAEEKFDVKIPDEEVKNLKTVGDAVSFITNAQA